VKPSNTSVPDGTTAGHSPKTGALIAYESGALSQRGRARVEKHLRGCEACRRELAAIQMYDASVDVIRDARLPEVQWSKMELALEREARVQAKAQAGANRRGWIVPAIGICLAAAAVLAMMLWPDAPETPTASHDPVPEAPAPERDVPTPPVVDTTPTEVASLFGARVTLVAGAATTTEGASLAEGASIATEEGGAVHVVLASASDASVGLALGGSSSLRFASLDTSGASVELESGRVSTRTRSTRTIVLAGDYRMEADVAWFVVDLSPEGALRLDVREGDVHVTGPATDRVVTGPARFNTSGPEARLDGDDVVGMVVDYGDLPRLHVARPGIVRWQIGDAAVTGAGELAMRVGAGDVSISAWDARGRELHTVATVGPDGLDLSPDELRPEAPRIRVGTLPTAVIRQVVSSHQSSLERCYERALRAESDLEARVEMQITVDMTGEVSAVHLGGDEIPAAMATCLSHDVEHWTFPAPDGGPMTFMLPMPFHPSGR
jgi:hypothetical protein